MHQDREPAHEGPDPLQRKARFQAPPDPSRRAGPRVVRDLEKSKAELQEKILDLEKFEEVVVGRELKMIALEKELEKMMKASEKRSEKAGREQ